MDHSLLKGLIQSHSIGDSSFVLSHLQFADDILLFSTADHNALQHLFEVIHVFEQASGLSINFSKRAFGD